ncbi:hypothetical protein NMG60_11018893 [Bertholletia excelsa]
MGLQGQVTDCSSESFLILVVAIIANFVGSLRSFAFTVLRSMGVSRIDQDGVDEGLLGAVSSGLAGLIVLAEQLSLNRDLSYRYSSGDCGDAAGSDCVVCLSPFSEGEHVRKLACRHIFHKDCFDGCLDHLGFRCPLCRASVVSPQRVASTEQRVSHDLLAFFAMR